MGDWTDGAAIRGERSELHAGDPVFDALWRRCGQGFPVPETLYAVGDPQALTESMVAITGSRKASEYGLSCARFAGESAGMAGLSILTTLAPGCEITAAKAALALGSRAVVFLASGIDQAWPESSRPLMQRIVDRGGAVVSAVPWGMPARRPLFMSRNRLMAPMGSGLVVCSCGMPSGTFSRAELAADYVDEVLAFPGRYDDPEYGGCNELIAEGATIANRKNVPDYMDALAYIAAD